MPTYKRPELLRRALTCLQAQTHQNWACYVLDDSPQHEAGAVVAELCDRRITYLPNEKNLGISLNIDRAFSPASFGNADYACVLEDDNLFDPEYFEKNLSVFSRSDVDVVFRNGEIENRDGRTGRLIYNHCYKDGIMNFRKLYATFFYSSGIYNCSIMWRLNAGIDLQVSGLAEDPVTEERMRTLRIARDVYIAMEPLVVWRDNEQDTYRKIAPGTWRLNQIKFVMYERAVYRALAAWLAARGLLDLAYSPAVGPLDSGRVRPFIRAGIPIPKHIQPLSPFERIKLKAKVIAMLAAAKALGIAPKFEFVDNRIHIASSRGRAR